MTEMKNVRLIFAGGGTGGHLFPALAIADRVTELLKDKMNSEIIFIGTKRGIEYRMKDKLGYPLHIINMRGIVRSFTLKNLLVPFIIIAALFKAHSLLKKFRPHIVIGTGGYVSWAILKAAASKKIPVIIQEQNSFPGVTTRQIAPVAQTIYLGFAGAEKYLKTTAEIKVVGNPVRKAIKKISKNEACSTLNLDPDKTTILILGGSQGARSVNNAVLKSLENNPLSEHYQLLWQTGKRDYKDVVEKLHERAKSLQLFPFANSMTEIYSAADIVIARAGALTIAEIINCGLPSLLIPYPFAAGDHQRKNAEELVTGSMATMILEDELKDKDILQEAVSLHQSESFNIMKESIKSHTKDKKEAVDCIAEDIISQLEAVA
ncbi:MAG: undecaprenyldiphospho-muramoylpentapeptide beta-N-acetylglucosaminyltransferase [Calditrichaeota bacterium]|nr:MAG: undecaprenyldiphospho-muramoylpentapeptide beta-N-acetylglucosaminyltransferase [Calditrichota bacterium]